MEMIRQKDRKEKLDRRERQYNKTDNKVTVPKVSEKQKGKGKTMHKRRIVRWKFLHDAKIPRILTKEAYLKMLPPSLNTHWDFSSDESLDRSLNPAVSMKT